MGKKMKDNQLDENIEFELVADFDEFGSLLVMDINDLFDEEFVEISALAQVMRS